MTDYGFFRVAAAVPIVKVADIQANTLEICKMIDQAESRQAALVVFPELSITGYTCADLFGQELLIAKAEESITHIKKFTRGKFATVIVGAPMRINGRLYNCAAVIRNGIIQGIVPKTYLPTYNEYYESRWFASGADFLSGSAKAGGFLQNGKDNVTVSPNQIFNIGKASVGIEICEDLWVPIPPSSYHALAGAQIIVNLSASNEILGKHQYRKSLVSQQSARTVSGYVYCSCGYGESTQDLVYAGSSLIYENGTLLAENERFQDGSSMIFSDIDVEKLQILRQKENTFNSISPDGTRSSEYDCLYRHAQMGEPPQTDFSKELFRPTDPHPFVPEGDGREMDARCREILSIQVSGLVTRLAHISCHTAVIGISGGLDSTLALIVATLAFDRLGIPRKGIIGVTMPGFGTTGRTHGNASDLMAALGVTSREISIVPAMARHFEDIGQLPENQDTTYENSQARERTQILMDIANKEKGIVIGTGDLSELALGWATYNGDHMSMYAVNASIPKTLVRHLVGWAAENHFSEKAVPGRNAKDILMDIIDTPISPELIPADSKGNIRQRTEDLVGPYDLHDFFLYNMFRFGYSPEKLLFLAKHAFRDEYDGPTIEKWLKTFITRFFSQQFKRSCMPDTPKVGSVSLSPRGDWRMPSDAWSDLFIKNI